MTTLSSPGIIATASLEGKTPEEVVGALSLHETSARASNPTLFMTDTKTQFLSFIDRCIEDDPSLVVPADEEQLNRFANILGIARQGIEQYSGALSQLA